MDSTIRDLCDCIMCSFEESEIRKREQDTIAKEIISLGNRIPVDCKKQYIKVLDDINISDSAAYYEAFRQGMYVAIALLSQNKNILFSEKGLTNT